jgi:uncharacterized membrane protein YtjA (UPF0391 family)
MKYFILGIIVATIGFSGIAKYLDIGVNYIQYYTRQIVK